MKITQTQVTLGLGLLGLAAVYFVGKKAIGAAGTVANSVNPLNQNNVFATGVNAVGGALVTDPAGAGKNADGSWTFGGFLYDLTHPATVKEVQAISGTVQKKSVAEPATFTPGDTSSVSDAYDYNNPGGYFAP